MMTYTAPNTADGQPQWVIDSVVDSFGPAGLSQPQRYKRVNYHTWQGDPSYVEVPLAPGWVDAAVKEIQQHVDDIYALKQRQGPQVE